MPLILGPSGNSLLLGPIGLPATSTNCCCCKEGVDCPDCPCCICIECGDGVQYSLPIDGCHNSSGKACLTVKLSGLTFATACRTFRGNDCVAAPGTWASYKYLSAAMPDLTLPFNWNDGVHTSIRDPDSPCNTINPDTVCCQWRTCLILADFANVCRIRHRLSGAEVGTLPCSTLPCTARVPSSWTSPCAWP